MQSRVVTNVLRHELSSFDRHVVDAFQSSCTSDALRTANKPGARRRAQATFQNFIRRATRKMPPSRTTTQARYSASRAAAASTRTRCRSSRAAVEDRRLPAGIKAAGVTCSRKRIFYPAIAAVDGHDTLMSEVAEPSTAMRVHSMISRPRPSSSASAGPAGQREYLVSAASRRQSGRSTAVAP